MNKKTLSSLMEWIRPVGIGVIIFCAYLFGTDPVERFHLLGPLIALMMSGTVAFEALFLGEAGSEKIGYTPNRAYQVQSGLANAAIDKIRPDRDTYVDQVAAYGESDAFCYRGDAGEALSEKQAEIWTIHRQTHTN